MRKFKFMTHLPMPFVSSVGLNHRLRRDSSEEQRRSLTRLCNSFSYGRRIACTNSFSSPWSLLSIALFYLHEVHQFSQEIKLSQKPRRNQTQSCRKNETLFGRRVACRGDIQCCGDCLRGFSCFVYLFASAHFLHEIQKNSLCLSTILCLCLQTISCSAFCNSPLCMGPIQIQISNNYLSIC